MKKLIKKILKEETNGLEWMGEVPSNINLSLYKFLENNFEVSKKVVRGYFSDDFELKHLIGMGESFNMRFESKSRIYNKLYWLVVDNFEDLGEPIIRRTVRKFLNDRYEE